MRTSNETMRKVLDGYFEAWQKQDSEMLAGLFAEDGVYRVKPFGQEEYFGRDEIRGYWEANPVARQVNPQPKLVTSVFGDDICFAEWETTVTTLQQTTKTIRGILLLEFKDGLIQGLREHYSSTEHAAETS